MSVTIEAMKRYGYLEEDFDEEIARLCLAAAKQSLRKAGVPEPEGDNELYDLAALMLAMHWYDHRGVVAIGTVQGEIKLGLDSIIHQIKDYPSGRRGACGTSGA